MVGLFLDRHRFYPTYLFLILNEQRAKLTAENYDIPQYYYTDLEEFLCKCPIEAVLVCTPTSTLYKVAIICLRAGKHVYVQKTFASRLKEAQKLIAKARRRNAVLVDSPEQMVNPTLQAARRMIIEGAIGPVYWTLCVTDHPGPQLEEGRLGEDHVTKIDPSWEFKPQACPIYNMGVYSLHSITGILGPIKRLTAFSGRHVHVRERKFPSR